MFRRCRGQGLHLGAPHGGGGGGHWDVLACKANNLPTPPALAGYEVKVEWQTGLTG